MKKIFIAQTCFLLIIAILAITTSCRKESTVKKLQYRINKAWLFDNSPSYPFSAIYQFMYDTNGRPSEIGVFSGVDAYTKSISYQSNIVTTLTTTGSGDFAGKRIITYNLNKIASIKNFNNAAETIWSNIDIIYDINGGLMKEISTYSNSSMSSTTNYTVANGDITRVFNSTGTIEYDYYTDKPVEQGDYFWFMSVTKYGVGDYLKSSHLPKSIFSPANNSIYTFIYDRNDKGLITKITIGTIVIEYEYEVY